MSKRKLFYRWVLDYGDCKQYGLWNNPGDGTHESKASSFSTTGLKTAGIEVMGDAEDEPLLVWSVLAENFLEFRWIAQSSVFADTMPTIIGISLVSIESKVEFFVDGSVKHHIRKGADTWVQKKLA